MDFTRRHFLGAALVTAAGISTAACVSSSKLATAPAAPPLPAATPEPLATTAAALPADLPPLVAEALAALETHSPYVAHRDRIGVVDFSLPSSEPRFHLVDVATGKVERSWLVAHGSGSDPSATGMLQRFSNVPGSNASSRGAYVTADAYIGKHGTSRRLYGLEADNNMAYSRAIVVHGADYVDPALAVRQGRIGRSQGCFAFEQREIATVLELLGEGRLIYASKLA